MATPFVAALDAEIADLEAAIAADPRHTKLRELKRVRGLYQQGSVAHNISISVRKRPRRSPSPERQAILDLARQMLAGKTLPTPTSKLFDGISLIEEIPGANPRNNLSAMLSNSPEFVSHGRAGWTLAETTEAADDLLSRSASAASNSSPASPAGESDNAPLDTVSGGGT